MTVAAVKPLAPPLSDADAVTVAVAGNPNSGKSTLINAIAGTRLQVGNWPRVTVEKKEAIFEHGARRIRVVDLPGTYSLSPYSQEEIVARDYLVRERPDVVVNVVDSTNLERNLYLTVQLLELGIPVVMALNMHDEAEAKGYRIDARALEERLGIRVVRTSATRRTGLDELLEGVLAVADLRPRRIPAQLSYGTDLDLALAGVSDAIARGAPPRAAGYPSRWLALKLMEGDPRVIAEIGADAPPDVLHHVPRGQRLHGARRIRHGPSHAGRRAARKVLHPDAARVRLQRPWHLRDALAQDVREIAVSFGSAAKAAAANMVSTWGVSSLSTEERAERAPLKAVLQRTFTPLSAYAFMIFVLLYVPCMVVAIAMRQEFGSWKWFGVACVSQSALAWVGAFVVYQGGRLLGLGG